jgi:hypothetical protein
MNTPEHFLDPPDSCDPAPDTEVRRLKEDVRALRDLLSEAAGKLVEMKRYIIRSPFPDDRLDEVSKLQDRIDAELNG